ncbi:formyltransferase family protein [Desulfarculus baarsii]
MITASPIFRPQGRPMRVAAFMSGSGSNIRRLLEQKSPHYEVCFIFSDRADGQCQGQNIALEYGLPYFAHDIRRFYALRGQSRTVATARGLELRRQFDAVAARLLAAFAIDVIALGGYMSFLTLDGAVNVHPADLSIVGPEGRRRFVGDDAVFEAIAAGQSELRASTLWTDAGVDSGPLLMVSEPLAVELPAPLARLKARPELLRAVADQHQERLKAVGDWVVFPRTIELIAQGRLGLGPGGVATLDGRLMPQGVRLADIA